MKRAKTKTEPEHRYTVSTSLRQKREREREKTRERERERERETYENKRRANRRQMIGGGRRHAEENGSGGSDRSRVQTASHLVPTRNRKPENRRAKRLPDLSEQVTTSPTDSDVFFYIFNPPPCSSFLSVCLFLVELTRLCLHLFFSSHLFQRDETKWSPETTVQFKSESTLSSPIEICLETKH